MLKELASMGTRHTRSIFSCWVCQTGPCEPSSLPVAKVGETASYPFCPVCGHFYFYPLIPDFVLHVLDSVGTDYTEYKRRIAETRARLAPMLRIPFSYEAHKVAVSRFAWSLFGPVNAAEVLQVLSKYSPNYKRIVSMGAGSGYIEHVFFQALRKRGQPNVEVLAFDAGAPPEDTPHPDPNRPKFSVQVQWGDTDSLGRLGDLRDAVLLLCWPPFGAQQVPYEERVHNAMASDSCERFLSKNGQFLVYVGDTTATGDWLFHEQLQTHWELLPETFKMTPIDTWVPQEMGLLYAGNDSVGVYRRRPVPLPPRDSSAGYVYTSNPNNRSAPGPYPYFPAGPYPAGPAGPYPAPLPYPGAYSGPLYPPAPGAYAPGGYPPKGNAKPAR